MDSLANIPNISNKSMAQRKYYEEHKTELLKKYKGKWICIDNETVIASGDTMHKILLALQKREIKHPESYTVYVSDPQIYTNV